MNGILQGAPMFKYGQVEYQLSCQARLERRNSPGGMGRPNEDKWSYKTGKSLLFPNLGWVRRPPDE